MLRCTEQPTREGAANILILSRRPSQTINIGADVAVTVLAVRGNQVRIGITAPRDTLVLRSELTPRPTPVPVRP